ncbi:signal peptide peptidase SppA [Novosphingobium aerophilum]|uniref:signal peptide peptidase SppA n=1 Tax=Novosphingobium TaxID=165696 RepID=UPI002D76F263|nr:signal peptide peptidase SppA [Novosphingobium sp. RL4]WRT92360.1 signal peptide peptidase SppA [Novosphingobium sp. RL4]
MTFARKIWKLLVGVKDALALIFLLLFFALLYAALTARPSAGKIENGALLLELDGNIVEEKSNIDPLKLLMSTEAPAGEYQARDIERALALAATDSRIKVVVLDLSRFLGGGMVHIEEIGKSLDAVRKAGKPVLAFANAYADDGVQLAAHASEVWVDPMGGAFVAGPGGNHLYFKGLIDRFKVNAHVYRAGTYKSFVEPYIRSDMSPAAREAYQDIYGALWSGYKADIARARPQARLDQMTGDPIAWAKASGGDFAQGAKASGLVDRIGDRTEFENRVAEIAGKDENGDLPYKATRLQPWLAANPEKGEGAKIGVVTIAGEIVDGDAGPGQAGGDRIADLLDDNIDEGFKALVVRVDSPGGSAMAAERIRRAIERYKARKIPIVVSMGNMAASGGYWVATPGQQIFAQPETITGSIGVFAVVTSFEKTLADYGVTSDGVTTTPLSGQPDVFAGFTPEVEGMLQASIESTYRKFVGLSAAARKTTPEKLDAIAQGRVWPGEEARRIGLVDKIGNLDAALAEAARLGGVGNGKFQAVYLKGEEDSITRFVNGLTSKPQQARLGGMGAYDFASLVSLRRDQQADRAMQQLTAMLSTRGAQAYCLECPVVTGSAQPRGAKAISLLETFSRLAGRD